MGKRSVITDVRDAFGSELDAGQQSALISWLAFTGTSSGVRGVTHAIRARTRVSVDVGIGGSSLVGSYFAGLPVIREVFRKQRGGPAEG
jgi:hypothetical protein